MALDPFIHGGGEAYGVVIDDTGQSVAQPAKQNVVYRIVIADKDNTGVVFLHLPPDPDDPATFGKGIPLWPGDFHEITYENMYEGVIKAIAPPGTTQTLFGHDGI